MATQVPLIPEPLPASGEQSSEEFSGAVDSMVNSLNPMARGMNTLAQEMQMFATNAEAAAGAIANQAWVSGTTYSIGNVRYSLIDFLDYRRKTNGAGTTDPKNDPTNWAPRVRTSAGGSDTTSSAVDVVLTATSGRLQIIDMTASGKKVTLPSATTLDKGASIFVIKNNGSYRFAVHINGAAFLCFVQPGQVLAFHCSDTSTGPGVWDIGGDSVGRIKDTNAAEVLNGVDSRVISVAMMTSTKAFCSFRNNSTTFLTGVVLNFGSASGTPAAINAEASDFISVAAQSGSQVTVVYKTSTGVTKGYVLDVTGNTFTPGPVSTISTAIGADGTGITALAATKLLCVYGAAGAKEKVLDITGNAITPSAEASASSVAMLGNPFYLAKKITATKALVSGFANTTNKYVVMALQSISGSNPAQTGSSLTVNSPGAIVLRQFGLAVMNSSRALLAQPIDQSYGDIMLSIIDISGTSPVLVASKIIRVGLIGAAHVSAAKLTGNTIYITWTGGASGGIDSAIVTMTSDDRIIVSSQTERVDPSVTSLAGYLDCDALDSTHVMQVHRNTSTFLSAKTLELSL